MIGIAKIAVWDGPMFLKKEFSSKGVELKRF